jgi:uncharacterized protein (TIGR00661 family)
MTQALALGEMLRARGHTLAGALVGRSARRAVPGFFRDALGAPLWTVESPTFVAAPDGRIRAAATAWQAARDLPRLSARLDEIAAALDRAEPDVVVNFYEGLMGTFARLRVLDVPLVAVAHQFMADHPAYPLLPGQPAQRLALRGYTALAGAGARVRLALSFYDAPDPPAGVRVVPPLLRRQVFDIAGRGSDGSLLVYLMEPAMAAPLAAWSDQHPDVPVHCFSDAPARRHSPSLTFHALSGTRFLEHMARARGVVCTAGFESVSEALWLGKPALMVPVPNHYEQQCNAIDGARSGAGIAARHLDLDRFLDYLGGARPDPTRFRRWVASAEQRIVGAIEEAAGVPPPAEAEARHAEAAPVYRQAA